MNISASEKEESVILSQEDIPDCEWHTKDPLTGEIFFLSKGVLYSKFPSKDSKRIISINKNENIKSNKNEKKKSIYLTNSAKFSSVYKGTKIQIFGGNSIANCSNQSEGLPLENYAIVTNIIHVGIVILEFICPISLTNLAFGMISEKDLKANNISKQFKNFKTSSRRNLIMKINYWSKNCSFYINDNKISSINFRDDENIPIVLIKKKSSCLILNPMVKYLVTNIDNFFKKEILFKLNEKEILNPDDKSEPGKTSNYNNYYNYLSKSFNKDFKLKYVFGDLNEKGEICNFICAKFDKKFSEELKKNFDKINTNKNISLVDSKNLKQIKKNLINSSYISYQNEVAFLSKLKNNYIKEEKDDNLDKDYDEEFNGKVVKYIIENFEKIEIAEKESLNELKNKFEKIKESKNLFENIKAFKEGEINGEENYNNIFINYLKNEDSILMINKNKIKVIKREETGLFDLSNFFDIKNSNYIIFEKQDLEYFLKNFDVKEYISYSPNFNKIHQIFSFLKSIENACSLGKNKIIIFQEHSESFYSSIISYLNFSAFVTKRQKVLAKRMKPSGAVDKNKKVLKEEDDKKLSEKEKMEKENLNLMNVFPFGCFENDIEAEETDFNNSIQIIDESTTENNLYYNDYSEFISKNPLIHAKLVKIINKIIAQISARNGTKIYGNNNIFNAYDNMASYINYPFIFNEKAFPMTALSDNGFYCENAFTNELKLYGYENIKLIDTDMLTSEENIELYLKENIPTYIRNSPLKDISPIINSSYIINNMNLKMIK